MLQNEYKISEACGTFYVFKKKNKQLYTVHKNENGFVVIKWILSWNRI